MTLKNFQQTTSGNNSLLVVNSSCSSNNEDQTDFASDEVPPAIPQKTKRKTERHPSPYDNVHEEKIGKFISACLPCHYQNSLCSMAFHQLFWKSDIFNKTTLFINSEACSDARRSSFIIAMFKVLPISWKHTVLVSLLLEHWKIMCSASSETLQYTHLSESALPHLHSQLPCIASFSTFSLVGLVWRSIGTFHFSPIFCTILP